MVLIPFSPSEFTQFILTLDGFLKDRHFFDLVYIKCDTPPLIRFVFSNSASTVLAEIRCNQSGKEPFLVALKGSALGNVTRLVKDSFPLDSECTIRVENDRFLLATRGTWNLKFNLHLFDESGFDYDPEDFNIPTPYAAIRVDRKQLLDIVSVYEGFVHVSLGYDAARQVHLLQCIGANNGITSKVKVDIAKEGDVRWNFRASVLDLYRALRSMSDETIIISYYQVFYRIDTPRTSFMFYIGTPEICVDGS